MFFKKLIPVALAFSLIASRSADMIKYRIPQVFELQKRIVYGKQSADIDFTLRSKFDLKNVTIILKTSHKGLLIKTESGLMNEISFTKDFAANKTYNFHYRALVKKKFTLASVTILLTYPFPTDKISLWVQHHEKKLYPIKRAREELYNKIANKGKFNEERFGVFLYGAKFIADRMKKQ